VSLARLLQLASPMLPVGAYSYSQGLEAAMEAGLVTDAASVKSWIADVLEFSMGTMEAPLLLRMIGDPASMEAMNALFLATRETAELRAETVQMGHSLARLLPELGLKGLEIKEIAYPTAYASAVVQWKIPAGQALVAYLWSWLENQVMAAIKGVPLGQTAGQRILLSLGHRLDDIAARASQLDEGQWSNFAPGLAFLSARHETQYSRLFRS
jgi:urease accessory protein